MVEPIAPQRQFRRRLFLLVLIITAVVWAVFDARPPRGFTIESGPEGGSYHQVALQYQEFLARRNIVVTVRPQPNSLEIVRDVADPRSDVQVGFIAQDVREHLGSGVFTIGQIQMQPLFVFASASLGRRSVMENLQGRRIVMPPEDSATSAAAVKVLALYDITAENSSLTFKLLPDAIRELRAGNFDAGIFMLAPENPFIMQLASDTSLRLIPYVEARAIANHLPFLQPVSLPRGIYNIADSIPPYDTPLVAATVGVVVKERMHPFLLYSLLDAMTALHRAPTYLSGVGEFPTLSGAQLAPHPVATAYYKSGLPWLYSNLPPWIASAADQYAVIALAMVMLGLILVIVGPIADLVSGLAEGAALAVLRRVNVSVSRTGRLSIGYSALLHVARWTLSVADHNESTDQLIRDIRRQAGK